MLRVAYWVCCDEHRQLLFSDRLSGFTVSVGNAARPGFNGLWPKGFTHCMYRRSAAGRVTTAHCRWVKRPVWQASPLFYNMYLQYLLTKWGIRKDMIKQSDEVSVKMVKFQCSSKVEKTYAKRMHNALSTSNNVYMQIDFTDFQRSHWTLRVHCEESWIFDNLWSASIWYVKKVGSVTHLECGIV